MKMKVIVVAAGVALAVSGCQRTVGGFEPLTPAPLTPAPVAGVTSSQLPPPGGMGQQTSPSQFPEAPSGQAAINPEDLAKQQTEMAANAPTVTRESLIGRWSVDSGGSRCDVFLALTKWTGGYRAASRGCVGAAANVSAWDVQGKQVLLSDNSGNQIARLYQSGNERYDGSTTAGQSISLSR